jgi:hypothetical protein
MEATDIPYSTEMDPTYENFIADCPKCGIRNIFNRASDLQTFEPIDLRTVICQACLDPFKINNDAINTAHEMLLFGCWAFIERKEYIQCVLSVAQAYEVSFSHFIHVQLIYRACAHEDELDLARLNRLTQQLYCRVRPFAFDAMRRLVLRLVVDGEAPASLVAAENAIAKLPKKAQNITQVPRRDVDGVPDDRLRALILRLHDSKVNKLRNRVIHTAYRPTREEAMHSHDEAREILFGLAARLRLGFDPNWYINKPGR